MKKANSLRQKAEGLLNKKKSDSSQMLSEPEMMKLLHELQVHKTELEAQNEELRKASIAAEEAIALYDNAPSGYFTLSQSGDILRLNLNGAKLLGKEHRQLLESRFGFFVSDDTRPVFNIFIDKVFSGKIKQSCEVKLNTDGNMSIYVHIEGIVSGTGTLCFLTVTDITESKQAIKELQESEERYSLALLAVDDGLWDWHIPSGNAIFSPHYYAILRYADGEFPATFNSWRQLVHPEDIGRVERHLKESFESDSSFISDFRMKRKTGEWLWVSARGKVVERDKLGEVVRVVGTLSDITERKNEEEKLRLSQEQFKLLVWSMQVGVILQGPNAEIILGNPKALELLGLTEAQLLGKTSFDPDWNVIHEDGAPFPGHTHPVPQAIATKLPVRDVVMGVYRPFNADRVWLLVDAEPQINDDGTVRNVVCTFIDITERKHAEDKIERMNLELEKSNSEKDKLFSIIAHDLRSPFHGLLGLTEVMATQSTNFSIKEITEYSKNLHGSVVNLYKLLVNLLEWAQFKKGATGFSPVELSLYDVYFECQELLKQRALQKEIIFLYDISESMRVYADEKMFSSVLRNLLFNAIKYTNRGGLVTVKARAIDNGMVEISVADNGVGMSEDIVGKLFKPGEKIHSKGTEGELSTGLGLLLCKEFVEKNGGKIWANSEEGKGSTFYFTVPLSLASTAKT